MQELGGTGVCCWSDPVSLGRAEPAKAVPKLRHKSECQSQLPGNEKAGTGQWGQSWPSGLCCAIHGDTGSRAADHLPAAVSIETPEESARRDSNYTGSRKAPQRLIPFIYSPSFCA